MSKKQMKIQMVLSCLPKRRYFRNITDDEIIMATKKLKDRPRKYLGFNTPNQVFFGLNSCTN